MRNIKRIQFTKKSVESASLPKTSSDFYIALLEKFGGSIAILTFISLLIGWVQLASYYQEIGVHWYVNMLTVSSIINTGGILVLLLIVSSLAGFCFHEYISQLESLKKSVNPAQALDISSLVSTLRLYESIFYLVTTIFMFLPFLLAIFPILSADTAESLTRAVVMPMFVFGLGFFSTSIFDSNSIKNFVDKSLFRERFEFQGKTLLLIILLIIFALQQLYTSLTLSAISRAKVDMNPDYSQLAYARKKDCSECVWRVVNVSEGKALLSQISNIKGNRKFQIVILDDKWIISR